MILSAIATVQEELEITGEETYLTRLLNEASDMITAYCLREFHFVADIIETHRGRARRYVHLNKSPIVSVSAVKINGDVITDHSLRTGMLYRKAGWPMGSDIEVTYNAGWVTPDQATDPALTRSLPYDIERACIDLVVHLYRRKGEDAGVAAEGLGDAKMTYDISGIPIKITQRLQSYRGF